MGCPIRIPVDQFVFANPHGFSQLITSFFASESLGIPHTPLHYFLYSRESISLYIQHVKELLNHIFYMIYSSNKLLFQYFNYKSSLLLNLFMKTILVNKSYQDYNTW